MQAVGEPPLFLASSVFFAVEDAIKSARAEIGLKGIFELNSPATAERIRMACEDQLTQKVCTFNYSKTFIILGDLIQPYGFNFSANLHSMQNHLAGIMIYI